MFKNKHIKTKLIIYFVLHHPTGLKPIQGWEHTTIIIINMQVGSK